MDVTYAAGSPAQAGDGYVCDVIAFFSSRLGCLGSLLVSLVLTALLIALLTVL
jgi:hypothetical protein